MLGTLMTIVAGTIALNVIPLTVILGASLAVGIGIGLAHEFWKTLLSFAKKCVKVVKKALKKFKDAVLQGVKTFIKKVYSAVQEIVKYYTYLKEENRWIETIQIREIPVSEVPEDIRERVETLEYTHAGNLYSGVSPEVDITEELSLKLAS